MEKLVLYLKKRAELENVPFDLDEEFLNLQFEKGIRNFFGVKIDDQWNMISDDQQPHENFLSDYLKNLIN